jgi:hypothetical protein
VGTGSADFERSVTRTLKLWGIEIKKYLIPQVKHELSLKSRLRPLKKQR